MNKYSSLRFKSKIEYPTDEFFLKPGRSLSSKSSLSIFTVNENLSCSKSVSMLAPKEISPVSNPRKKDLISSRNFSELIGKLEEVITPRQVLSDQIFSDKNEINCKIGENTYSYLKINIKNKASPLKINVKRQGRILIYAAFSISKPSATNFEQIFSSDFFEVFSKFIYFREEFIYFGIKALSDANIVISYSFGRKLQIEKKRVKNEANVETMRPRIKIAKKIKKVPEGRNFIEENLKILTMNPEEFSKRGKEWSLKREVVLSKKKNNLENKKLKALNFLNKRKIREEERKIEQVQYMEYLIKIGQMKVWLILLYILKSSSTINEVRSEKREEISKDLLKRSKVRALQKFYRQTTKSFDIRTLTLLRASLILNFFCKCTKGISYKSTKKMLISVIKSTGVNRKPILAFLEFKQNIIKIQFNYRKYLNKKTERMRNLIIFWDECKVFQSKRPGKIRKKMVYDLNISIYQRNIALQLYYAECIKRFYESLREPGFFISQEFSCDKKICQKMTFFYKPSSKKMKDIIESAYLIPERVVLSTSDTPTNSK